MQQIYWNVAAIAQIHDQTGDPEMNQVECGLEAGVATIIGTSSA